MVGLRLTASREAEVAQSGVPFATPDRGAASGGDVAATPRDGSVLCAGGVGIASVYLLADQLVEQETDVHLIYGARTAADLVCLDYFEALPISLVLTTEDGSRGLAGRVTGPLGEYLPGLSPQNSVVYTCGPNPMMRAVSSQVVPLGVPCQISVETKMACGFGVCLGCSVKVGDRYRLACTHGPVFEAAGFQWEEEVESRTFA